jgi:hypothetical protein
MLDLIPALARQASEPVGRATLQSALLEVRDAASSALDLVGVLEYVQEEYAEAVARGDVNALGRSGEVASLIKVFFSSFWPPGSGPRLPDSLTPYLGQLNTRSVVQVVEGAFRFLHICTKWGAAVEAALAVQAARCAAVLPARRGLGFHPAELYVQCVREYTGDGSNDLLRRILSCSRASAPTALRGSLDAAFADLSGRVSAGLWASRADAARLHDLLMKFTPYWTAGARMASKEVSSRPNGKTGTLDHALKWHLQSLSVFAALANDDGPIVLNLWYLHALQQGLSWRCSNPRTRSPGRYLEGAVYEIGHTIALGMKAPFDYVEDVDGSLKRLADRSAGSERKRKSLERMRMASIWNWHPERFSHFGILWRDGCLFRHLNALRASGLSLDRDADTS